MLTPTLTSPRTAIVDNLRSAATPTAVQIASIVLFAVLTIAGAQIRLYVWEVPFTLQTIAVYGSGLFLGWRNGLLSQILYLSIGMVLPVFAGAGFGPAYLFGAASTGYLIGFLFAAVVVGKVSEKWNSLTGSTIATLCGSFVLFASGIIWLHFAAGHGSWLESIDKGWLRFIPVDLAKIMVVSLLYSSLRRIR